MEWSGRTDREISGEMETAPIRMESDEVGDESGRRDIERMKWVE